MMLFIVTAMHRYILLCILCYIVLFISLGGLYAVHQHCGSLSGEHELPCAPAVRVHSPGPGPVSRGQIKVYL